MDCELSLAFIDNEENQLSLLKSYCLRFEKENQLTIVPHFFSSGFDFLEKYPSSLDGVFMDINMPGMDGMETARKLRGFDASVPLLFITNLAQYAIEGYKVQAMDYVLKPVSYFDFANECKKILRRKPSEDQDSILIKERAKVRRVLCRDILYISIFNHDVTIFTSEPEGNLTFRGSLKEMEQKLSPSRFSRCNNCYIVNLEFAQEIRDGAVLLMDGTRLAISKLRRKPFLNDLTRYNNR
jgi:two-component system response regulator LytT